MSDLEYEMTFLKKHGLLPEQAMKRVAELEWEARPVLELAERIAELEAKLDAVKNVKTSRLLHPLIGMEASGSSYGTYRVVQWAKWDDVLEALGEAK